MVDDLAQAAVFEEEVLTGVDLVGHLAKGVGEDERW